MCVSMNIMWLIPLLCLCASVYTQEWQPGPRVNTTQGVVVGSHVTDGDYFVFYGIHYGGDTGGANRFKAPTPPPVYNEEFHAKNNTVRCAHQGLWGIIGTEDCLVLNIHTNDLTNPKPVLVWIEGEEYETSGNTLYPFQNLIEKDLVVVSINYRLSIFGFLCLGVTDAPGNAGLKDIVQGLKWIKENIAGFGGDPNNVVLLGHGSGAAMVDLITLSPMAQNLTHKAIVLSGSGLAPWAISYNPVNAAQLIGSILGYSGLTRDELAKKLASTDINRFSDVLFLDLVFYNNSLLFAPCVENPSLNPLDTFLPDAPINILRTGEYNKIPYMAGYVDREGTLRARQTVTSNWLQKMETNFGDFIQVDLAFESEANRTALTQNVRTFYFGEGKMDMEQYLDYHGDSLIVVPVTRAARERAARSTDNVWLFQFTFKGRHNSDWEFPHIFLNGVRHGGILNYLFNYNLIKHIDNDPMERITNRFTAFAYTGNPDVQNWTNWTPVRNDRLFHTLVINGGELSPNVTLFYEKVDTGVNQDTRDFWEPILATHYIAPKPVSSAQTLLAFSLTVVITQMLLKLC